MTKPKSAGKLAKRPTIRDLANATGLSVGAVSQILTGKRKGRPENVAKIEQAIEKYGYRSNLAARSLSSGRSRTIGIVFFFDMLDSFNAVLLAQVEACIREAGFDVLTSNLLEIEKNSNLPRARLLECYFNQAFVRLLERRVEGVISHGYVVNNEIAQNLLAEKVPLSVWEPEEPMPSTVSTTHVYWDSVMHLALEHLVNLGHRDILLLAGMRLYAATREEASAFQKTMERFNLSWENRIVYSDTLLSEEFGYRFIAEARHEAPPTTAIVCADDRIAAGVLCACYSQGIKIPRDLSVIGVDDNMPSRYTCPPLTTIRINTPDAARKLVDGLLHTMKTGRGVANSCSCEIIVRESVAPPQKYGVVGKLPQPLPRASSRNP